MHFMQRKFLIESSCEIEDAEYGQGQGGLGQTATILQYKHIKIDDAIFILALFIQNRIFGINQLMSLELHYTTFL